MKRILLKATYDTNADGTVTAGAVTIVAPLTVNTDKSGRGYRRRCSNDVNRNR
jgi:hypothetical protein